MKKKFLSLLPALALMLSLLPAAAHHAHAEKGNEASVTIGGVTTEYAHIHQPSGGYTALGDDQHSFDCACGETITEDCEYGWQGDNEEHWLECVYCWHMDTSSVEAHRPGADCLCECGFYAHQAEIWTVHSEDENLHTGTCSVCHETVVSGHDLTWGWDDEEHWTACSQDCGYKAAVFPHQWCDWMPNVGGFHYRNCGCGMVQEERHTDSDSDLFCDICGGNMCVDGNGDHICDNCHYTMEELCADADGDHRCDTELCGIRIPALCADGDGDHICDTAACAAFLSELCADGNGDWLCDVCLTDLCSHWLVDPAYNGDNTHTGICGTCKRTITEPCDEFYGIWWDETTHQRYCSCRRTYPEEPHNYSRLHSTTPVSHLLECSDCSSSIYEEHRFSSGSCVICETEQTEVFDVYVGGVGLKSGDYLDLAGNVSSEKPAGGYAHYENGVLTLHNYDFDGEGFLWKEDSTCVYTASLYAAVDLILELSGENSLTNTSDMTDKERDGIAAERSLTVRGDGSLTVLADNDGIYGRNGSLTVEEGSVYLGLLEYDEYGDLIENEEIGDDGIDVDGDVIVTGGELTVNANDHGMDINGNVIIRGGFVDVTADDDGLNVEDDIVILGGDVAVCADDYGLDSDDGSVIIAGGHVDVDTDTWSGICAGDNVEIYGGALYVYAGEAGIDGSHVTVYGGYAEISGGWVDIYCEAITLHVDLPEDATMDEYPDETYIDSAGALIIDADHACIDRYSADHICDTCGDEVGVHEAAEGKHTCDHCGGGVTHCHDGTNDALCDVCGKNVYLGRNARHEILLENVPAGLTLIIVGYDGGQLKAVQVVQSVSGNFTIDDSVLACEEVLTFFLDSGFIPEREAQPV